jgi:16S rRNA (guanine(966)-N(2))-methyltransferase RsmD
MRVIGGQYRSRLLKTLPGMEVRPTPDRLREALFNVLAPIVPGSVFIDAYAGCGAVGIEALSRGAARVVFIEKNPKAATAIAENLAELSVREGVAIRRGAVRVWLARLTADIVFLDPPYDLAGEYETALGVLGENPPRLAIAQHASHSPLREAYGNLCRFRVLRQGDNSLSFYQPAGGAGGPHGALRRSQ